MSFVNKDSVVTEFIELVKIDSLSKNERLMADCLKKKLMELGYDVYEDDTGSKIGGNAGNIITKIPGNKDVPSILLMAHMDTVIPGINKKPIVENGIIKTDGSTILGADDLAGVVSILEAIRIIKKEESDHGDIYVVFTVAEEGGLIGAKNLDYSKIDAKYAFILDDGGEIGEVAIRAPSQYKYKIKVNGKSAHAGIEPETGISAISIAAEAISNMKLGRIDEETTANIGIINGGKETNIISDLVTIKAEGRSRDIKKLDDQTKHMKKCFEDAVNKYGGSFEFDVELMYSSFNIDEDSEIIKILKDGAEKTGIQLMLGSTGGGSDTNVVNQNGILAVDLSIGMRKVHTLDEYIYIDDLVKSIKFLVNIIKSVKK